MLKRTELRKLATDRLRDAQALPKARRSNGAIYICGYAIELALKARIFQTLRWADFPETAGEFDKHGMKLLKTHDFSNLLRFSGREGKIKSTLMAEWSVVIKWQPELRYQRSGTSTKAGAVSMISSVQKLMKSL